MAPSVSPKSHRQESPGLPKSLILLAFQEIEDRIDASHCPFCYIITPDLAWTLLPCPVRFFVYTFRYMNMYHHPHQSNLMLTLSTPNSREGNGTPPRESKPHAKRSRIVANLMPLSITFS